MGIQDLWPLVKAFTDSREPAKLKVLVEDFKKTFHMSRNYTGGVDVSMEVWAAMTYPQLVEHLAVDLANNNDISHYVIGHFEELRQLFQRCNIDIILVFDGANHPLKRITQAERKEKRDKAEKDLEQFKQ